MAMFTRPRRAPIQISHKTFDQIEGYIQWARAVGNPTRFNMGMDTLIRFMAYTNQGLAQRMSAGKVDPEQNDAAAAWKIPVRRITENYYYGWKVRRVRPGTWELYNDSREAYFIEFGIHRNPATGEVSSRRIRRPIRKLSLRRTLDAMMTTQVYHRVWSEIYVGKPRIAKGFSQTVQSPGMGSFAGPGKGVGVRLF